MTERVYEAPTPHRCNREADGKWAPDDLTRGTVEVCHECGTAWVYDPIPWERAYRRLRPWPFDRAQRAALRDSATRPDKAGSGD